MVDNAFRKRNDKAGQLTIGHDEAGRRLIKVRVNPQSSTYRIVAVELEEYRGVTLPRPVPVLTEVQ